MWAHLLKSLLLIIVAGYFSGAANAQERIMVFAAASMADAMRELGTLHERQCRCTVVFSFAATSALARQIENGGPADVFVSADALWMDYLEKKNQIVPNSRIEIAGNRLVIAVSGTPSGSPTPQELLGEALFAMADPRSVPAGRYGQAALQTLGIWETSKANAIFAENVRVALRLVSRGDVRAAIVYASDLRVEPGLRELYRFPAESHPQIRYPAALTRRAGDAAAGFLKFLGTAEASAVLAKYGFEAVKPGNS